LRQSAYRDLQIVEATDDATIAIDGDVIAITMLDDASSITTVIDLQSGGKIIRRLILLYSIMPSGSVQHRRAAGAHLLRAHGSRGIPKATIEKFSVVIAADADPAFG
jgi:hypothetical protein